MKTIDQVLSDKLASWYVGEWPVGNIFLCAIALLLCAILCGAIGLERERRGRTAGLRTHLLVGIGSCIIMIISIYGFPNIKVGETYLTRDVARLAAQVIAGVGFLGAGAIIHRSSGARGLTTAATIWIVMAIGLACGSMNFILATGGTLLILFFLTFFKKLENKLSKKSPLIFLRADSNVPLISKILEVANNYNCTLNDIRSDIDEEGLIEMTFLAAFGSSEFSTEKFLEDLQRIEGVKEVNLLNTHTM